MSPPPSRAYAASSDDRDARMTRVETCAPMVKRLAHHLAGRLPSSVEVDDLIQVGMIGLMEAAQNFDAAQGVQFETFAYQRIRGAMFDELRAIDWLPRQVRKQLREVEGAIHKLEHKLGRAPQEAEIAQHIGMPLPELQKVLDDGRGHQLLYLEDFADEDGGSMLENLLPDESSNPLRLMEESGFRRTLVDAIGKLPDREKLLMSLYYEQELNLKEIGEVLGVTESRVSQLHTQAVGRLRAALKEWLDERRTR